MRKLFFLALFVLSASATAAENDAPAQDADQQQTAEVETQPTQEAQDNALIAADETETEEESAVRFIPTEQISQDLGVSFPVDI